MMFKHDTRIYIVFWIRKRSRNNLGKKNPIILVGLLTEMY